MKKIKTPGWVTGVGIIAIVLSGFGVMGGIQEALTPIMIEAQRADFEIIIEELGSIPTDDVATTAEEQQILNILSIFTGFIEKILNMPEWYLNWLVLSGFLSTLINGLYLFSAIWLLQLKTQAPKYLTIALPLSIALGITRTVMAVKAFDTIALFVMGGTIIAIIIEIILLMIVLVKDKSAFNPLTDEAV